MTNKERSFLILTLNLSAANFALLLLLLYLIGKFISDLKAA
jgi:hypothetical protein